MISFDAFNPVTFSIVTNPFNNESVVLLDQMTLISTDSNYQIFGMDLVCLPFKHKINATGQP